MKTGIQKKTSAGIQKKNTGMYRNTKKCVQENGYRNTRKDIGRNTVGEHTNLCNLWWECLEAGLFSTPARKRISDLWTPSHRDAAYSLSIQARSGKKSSWGASVLRHYKRTGRMKGKERIVCCLNHPEREEDAEICWKLSESVGIWRKRPEQIEETEIFWKLLKYVGNCWKRPEHIEDAEICWKLSTVSASSIATKIKAWTSQKEATGVPDQQPAWVHTIRLAFAAAQTWENLRLKGTDLVYDSCTCCLTAF